MKRANMFNGTCALLEGIGQWVWGRVEVARRVVDFWATSPSYQSSNSSSQSVRHRQWRSVLLGFWFGQKPQVEDHWSAATIMSFFAEWLIELNLIAVFC